MSALIARALDQIPELDRTPFDDAAFHLAELFARGSGMPFEVWLGRSLRDAPAELLEFWSDYYFDPALMGNEHYESLAWLRHHHLSQGVERARRFANREDSSVRIEALATLEHFLKRDSVPDLMEKLADPVLEVRMEASQLLMRHGINAAMPGDRSVVAEENLAFGSGLESLVNTFRGEFHLPSIGIETPFLAQIAEARLRALSRTPRSAPDLLEVIKNSKYTCQERSQAIDRLAAVLPIHELVPTLRGAMPNQARAAYPVLEALDRIQPDWDQSLRGVGAEIFAELGRQWQQRFPDRRVSDRLRPALAALGVIGKSSAGATAGLAGIGTALGVWLFSDQAYASFGEPAASGGSFLPWLLLGGAATVFSIRLAEAMRGSGPPLPPAPPAPRALLGAFESAYDINESYPIGLPEPGEVLPIGRSTAARAGIFPTELRHIARQHLEIREHVGRVEIRVPNRARVVRINGYNLTFGDWYVMNDGDIVEFVSEPRSDILVWQDDPQHAGQLVQTPLRLGETGYRTATGADQAAIFRFRRALPMPASIPPPAAAGKSNWFGDLRESLRSFVIPEPPPESLESIPPERPSEAPATPPTAAIDMNALSRDILRFSDQLRGAINLYEAALGAPGTFQPSAEALHALVVAHRSFCGTAERIQRVAGPEGLRVSTLSMIKVPNWDGVLMQRLQYYERALLTLPEAERNSPHSEGARSEIAKIRDRLNRLLEIVGRYRVYYSGAAEQEIFDAIERAYHGLRQPKRRPAERVRSPTRTLDAEVRTRERELWIQDFLIGQPPSRAIINMRIIMGDIEEVRGEAVVGSFYRALEQSSLEQGYRAVRAHYDLESGEIVAFNDGSRAVTRALKALERQGRKLAELSLHVDTIRSGRILDVSGMDPETRESILNPLTWLRGLQVLPDTDSDPPPPPPPEAREEISGLREVPAPAEWEDATARSYPARRDVAAFTEPNQAGEAWVLELAPDIRLTITTSLRKVVAITSIANSEPPISLLTLEGVDSNSLTDPSRQLFDPHANLQLWVESSSLTHLQVSDLVAVRRHR